MLDRLTTYSGLPTGVGLNVGLNVVLNIKSFDRSLLAFIIYHNTLFADMSHSFANRSEDISKTFHFGSLRDGIFQKHTLPLSLQQN